MTTPLLIDNSDTNIYIGDKMSHYRWFTVIIFIFILLIVFNSFAIHIALESSNATCYQNATITTLSNYVLLNSSINIAISIAFIVGLVLTIMIEIDFEIVLAVLMLTPFMVFLGLFLIVMTMIGAVEIIFSFQSCENEVYPICLMSVFVMIYNLLGCIVSWTKACTN